MELIIDIPEKSLDIAKAYLLSSCDDEEQEKDIARYCDKLKAHEGPVSLNIDKVKDEFKQQLRDLRLALALIAIGSMGLQEEDGGN